MRDQYWTEDEETYGNLIRDNTEDTGVRTTTWADHDDGGWS